MAVYSSKWRYLFVCVPDTGCTATAQALREHCDGEWIPKTDIKNWRRKIVVEHKHSRIPDMLKHRVITRSELDDLHVFATVRNPFDMCVSDYFRNKRWQALVDRKEPWIMKSPGLRERVEAANRMDFNEFVRHFYGPLRDQPRIQNEHYYDGVPNLIRHETLQDDFNRTLKAVGFEREVTIPKVNVSKRDENYRVYFDDESREILEDVFRPALLRFGYSF